MKFLFKDEVIAKLRKAPTFVWYVVFAVSYFFKDAYSLTQDAQSQTNIYVEAFKEVGIEGVNTTALTVCMSILSVVVFTVIFELVLWLAYSILQRRFVLNVNKSDFSFRVRLVFIISNIILGCVGIPYFFTTKVISILSAIFDYSVPTLLLGWFYEDFRVRYVPKRRHAAVFAFVALIYVGVYFIISAFGLVFNLAIFNNGSLSVIDTVALCLDTAIVAITALLAYLNYRRLLKISDEPEEEIIVSDDGPDDGNIFKDLGF